MQRCRPADYPDYLAGLEPLIEVPAETITLDYLIGDPARVGHGLGSAMLRAIIAATWVEHPRTARIVVPVTAANRASRRALEKAGMRRLAEGELPPDNPIDDGWHFIYAIDRPGRASAGAVITAAHVPGVRAREWVLATGCMPRSERMFAREDFRNPVRRAAGSCGQPA